MRLLIREYLEMLKESGEFDRLIPELLLAMKIAPISRAQVGVRQGGVDIAAVGKTKDGQDCLFLFVLKRGNIGRNDWDSGPTAIRQSLNEIKDTYLSNWVSPKHKDFLKKIIISTTGDIKQDTKPNLDGYIKENAVEGKLEYEIWNGDTVALLIEEHLFNEHLLSDESKCVFLPKRATHNSRKKVTNNSTKEATHNNCKKATADIESGSGFCFYNYGLPNN